MQGLKLVAAFIMAIFAISLLIGKSPVILFSGLGAMSAVLMLMFKDSIMGLVAGIQLSANNMLAVGDWLEMPKYGADGDVIDISLTTVKVSNWDRTITTVPTYALISDSLPAQPESARQCDVPALESCRCPRRPESVGCLQERKPLRAGHRSGG